MKMDGGEVKSRRQEDGGADRTNRAAGHRPWEGVNVALQEVARGPDRGFLSKHVVGPRPHQNASGETSKMERLRLICSSTDRKSNNLAETLITGPACFPLAPHSIIYSNQSLGRPEGGLTPPAHCRLHQHLWGFTRSRGPRFIQDTPPGKWTEEVPQTAHRSLDTQRFRLRTKVVQSDACAPAHTVNQQRTAAPQRGHRQRAAAPGPTLSLLQLWNYLC